MAITKTPVMTTEELLRPHAKKLAAFEVQCQTDYADLTSQQLERRHQTVLRRQLSEAKALHADVGQLSSPSQLRMWAIKNEKNRLRLVHLGEAIERAHHREKEAATEKRRVDIERKARMDLPTAYPDFETACAYDRFPLEGFVRLKDRLVHEGVAAWLGAFVARSSNPFFCIEDPASEPRLWRSDLYLTLGALLGVNLNAIALVQGSTVRCGYDGFRVRLCKEQHGRFNAFACAWCFDEEHWEEAQATLRPTFDAIVDLETMLILRRPLDDCMGVEAGDYQTTAMNRLIEDSLSRLCFSEHEVFPDKDTPFAIDTIPETQPALVAETKPKKSRWKNLLGFCFPR